MLTPPFVFVLLTCFNLISGYVSVGKDEPQIKWPTEYHFSGEKLDFATTIKTPFSIWYSEEQNRSRIDFFGGSTKNYYYGDKKVKYTVFPTTNLDFVSEKVCTLKSWKEGPIDYMPDVSAFTPTGETTILFDKLVEVWTGKEENRDIMKKQTLYVYRTEHGYDIPIQHIVTTYNTIVGKVASHYVTNFYNFKDSVTKEELKVEVSFCTALGELGEHFETDIQMLHPDIWQEVDIAFDSYSRHHTKQYQEEERQKRKTIFEERWRMVHEHNRKNLGFKLELNQYSDKTKEELKYLTETFVSERPTTGIQAFPHTLAEIDELAEKLPESYDLRIEGFVTSVKNQGKCGSCWAFSTTAAVEGALAKKNGHRLIDLSEQSLVNCAWTYNNNGCNGGTLDGALKYVYANGIPTEEEYGIYTENEGFCEIRKMSDVSSIKGLALVTPRNPNAMKVALHKYGPVAVAIHASELMPHYASGIFYDFSCTNATSNHGVTVVGYGNRDGEDYWIVKNSWGESWGEDGYILMSAKNNNCLVLDTPYYPIV